MWIALIAAFALASPDRPFPRQGETVRVRQYAKVEGEPPIARWRNKAGAFEAWTFPDGTVEHYRRYDKRVLVEERLFDATGGPLATITYEAETPVEVVVHGRSDRAVPARGWEPYLYEGAVLRVPGEPVVEADGASAWAIGAGALRLRTLDDAADVWSDDFRAGVGEACGCVLLDRTTAFVQGVAGARYLVRLPDPDRPLLGELWAFPHRGRTLLIAFLAPAGPDPVGVDDPALRLAEGRAIVSLVSWEKP